MSNRRKRLTIPREFRNRTILVPLCLILIVFNLVIISNIFFGNETVLSIFSPEIIFVIGILELILIFGIVFSGVLTAHRTAGPMIALEKSLNNLGSGDLTINVTFRKQDFNQNIADSFNENIEKLRKQVVIIKELTAKLEEELPENHISREILAELKQELDYLET
jgi:methyl-accepting chemotaxis protein